MNILNLIKEVEEEKIKNCITPSHALVGNDKRTNIGSIKQSVQARQNKGR